MTASRVHQVLTLDFPLADAPDDDRKLVAALVDPDEWRRVMVAEAAIVSFRVLQLGARSQPHRGAWGSNTDVVLAQLIETVIEGARALQNVAELSETEVD